MSSRLNLNDTTESTFQFTIGGLDYDLKYPTMEEIEPITELSKEREKLEKEETPESVDKIAELDKKLEDTMYGFIIPVGHDTPIKETLKKQAFPVVKAFNQMMAKQLSAE